VVSSRAKKEGGQWFRLSRRVWLFRRVGANVLRTRSFFQSDTRTSENAYYRKGDQEEKEKEGKRRQSKAQH